MLEVGKLPVGLEMYVVNIGLPTKDGGRERRARRPMVMVKKTSVDESDLRRGIRATLMHCQRWASNTSCRVAGDQLDAPLTVS